MEQSGFIVSVDFGTSKIVGVLGRKNEQGVISILASESIPSDSCVRYGVIYNTDEAAGKIKKIVSLLENQTGKKIGRVYVSISGRSLRAIEHAEIRHLDGRTPLTFIEIDKMEQQAKLNKPDFFTNYSVLAPEYYLDNEYEEDPIDKVASSIEGRYRLVIGKPNIKNNLITSVTKKSHIDIAGFIVGPVATGVLLLDDATRQAGCALIDFGAGTTTLSIYQKGILRSMSVIPFGGRTITKDIQALGFVYDSAEAYKIKYGKVGKDKTKQEKPDSPDVDLRELNKVIQLRQDEIILNVLKQIEDSAYSDELEAGIIVTGGASLLTGLTEYLADKSGMPVKMATPKRAYINNAADLLQNPIYTQVLSLLIFANENCELKEVARVQPVVAVEPKPVQPKPQPKAKEPEKKEVKEEPKKQKSLFDFFEKIQNFGGTMFKEEED